MAQHIKKHQLTRPVDCYLLNPPTVQSSTAQPHHACACKHSYCESASLKPHYQRLTLHLKQPLRLHHQHIYLQPFFPPVHMVFISLAMLQHQSHFALMASPCSSSIPLPPHFPCASPAQDLFPCININVSQLN